jgi:4-aminobutyrate aminotransferase-like enzyme
MWDAPTMPPVVAAAESEVRLYCREFPVTFARAHGSTLAGTDGQEYIDLLCGAGALNLGHNHPALTSAVVSYLLSDGPSSCTRCTTPYSRRAGWIITSNSADRPERMPSRPH